MIKAKVHLCPACQAPAAMPSSLPTEIDAEIGVRCNCIKINEGLRTRVDQPKIKYWKLHELHKNA